jgi:hypothetical protein
MIGEPRQTVPPECHPRPLVNVCATQHTSLRHRIMFDRLGVVIPSQPTKLYGRLRILHTGLIVPGASLPDRKNLAIKKPDRNTEKELK